MEDSNSVAVDDVAGPQRTALYRHFDHEGRLLYVGISLSAVERLAQHSRSAKWSQAICHITVHWFHSREAALDAEVAAIAAERPAYNIVHNSEVVQGKAAPSASRRVNVPMLVDSPAEVAAHFGISSGTVQRLVRDGMPRIQISNRKYQYDLPAVRIWLDRHKAGGSTH